MGEQKYREVMSSQYSAPKHAAVEDLLASLSLRDDSLALYRSFRKNLNDLDAIKKLGEDQNIILFTPAVPNPTGEDMDPFEPLGRAMTRYHQRVKHVPFTKHGFTDVHRAFLEYGGAVVIVLAEPARSSGSDHPRSTGRKDAEPGVRSQSQFGKDVMKALRELGVCMPLVLVVCAECGKSSGPIKLASEPDTFGTVLHVGAYDATCLEQIAWKMFDDHFERRS